MKETDSNGLSRRDFLSGAAMTAAAVAAMGIGTGSAFAATSGSASASGSAAGNASASASGSAAASASASASGSAAGSAAASASGSAAGSTAASGSLMGSSSTEGWDYDADVVVVGAGGAGHMAACAAVEAGSTAIMFEKQPSLMGDTCMCACEMCGCWPDRTKQDSGEDDSVEKYMADWENSNIWSTMHYVGGEDFDGERVLTQREIELCPDTFQWLQDTAGVVWATFDDSSWDPQPKWETVKPRNWKAMDTKIIPPLATLAATMGIQTIFDARANMLYTDDSGRVIGVRFTTTDGKSISCKADKAVVISTGSFMREGTLVYDNMPQLLYSALGCSPGASGEGHKMVHDIGGSWKDMALGARYAPVEVGSYTQMMMGSWYYCGITKPQVPGIFVNVEGKRFAAESIGYSFSAYEILQQTFRMAYYLVDQTAADATHLFGDNAVTAENMSESGLMLYQADTIEELATKMNMDSDILAAEVERYNGFVDAGTDEDFGKVMDGTTRIETPPYYALAEMCAPYNTFGGIETDVDSHVLDVSGNIIPGLYAAGSCCGSYAEQEGLYYTGGVVQAMTFGRQAGQNAAAESPVA